MNAVSSESMQKIKSKRQIVLIVETCLPSKLYTKFFDIGWIIGVPLIDACLKNKTLRVELGLNLYSLAFSEKNILIEGDDDNLELARLVKLMMGSVARRLSRKTSFLIANKVNSRLYHEAVKMKIPIHHSDLVRQLLRASFESYDDDDEHKIENAFASTLLPPFFGLRIAIEGYDADRIGLEEILVKNGGIIHVKEDIDVIVVERNSHHKGENVVNGSWVSDSFNEQICKSFDKYRKNDDTCLENIQLMISSIRYSPRNFSAFSPLQNSMASRRDTTPKTPLSRVSKNKRRCSLIQTVPTPKSSKLSCK